jgi:hypothetical protein
VLVGQRQPSTNHPSRTVPGFPTEGHFAKKRNAPYLFDTSWPESVTVSGSGRLQRLRHTIPRGLA